MLMESGVMIRGGLHNFAARHRGSSRGRQGHLTPVSASGHLSYRRPSPKLVHRLHVERWCLASVFAAHTSQSTPWLDQMGCQAGVFHTGHETPSSSLESLPLLTKVDRMCWWGYLRPQTSHAGCQLSASVPCKGTRASSRKFESAPANPGHSVGH